MITEIPSGWWIRSNVADHTLEWGDTEMVWGDYIQQEYLGEILDEIELQRQETR